MQRELAGVKLLIIDELGYVPLSTTGAELLFEVFSQRYERGSTIVTSPGAIATDFSGGTVRDNPQVNKAVAGMTALGRVGEPDAIGPMIASLLSNANRRVNAQRIEVSGGMQL